MALWLFGSLFASTLFAEARTRAYHANRKRHHPPSDLLDHDLLATRLCNT
jgi:hypothetical protein